MQEEVRGGRNDAASGARVDELTACGLQSLPCGCVVQDYRILLLQRSTDSLRHSDTYSESTACQKALSVASSRILDSPRCYSTDLQSVYSVHPSRGCPCDVGRCGRPSPCDSQTYAGRDNPSASLCFMSSHTSPAVAIAPAKPSSAPALAVSCCAAARFVLAMTNKQTSKLLAIHITVAGPFALPVVIHASRHARPTLPAACYPSVDSFKELVLSAALA